MWYRLAADSVVIIHFAFVAFVIGGGFLAVRWRRLALLHIPAAVWGALIEFTGWVCPLTPLEVYLRQIAGDVGYVGGFIEHYLTPILYPAGLTGGVQVVLGVIVVALNTAAYGWYVARGRRRRARVEATPP